MTFHQVLSPFVAEIQATEHWKPSQKSGSTSHSGKWNW